MNPWPGGPSAPDKIGERVPRARLVISKVLMRIDLRMKARAGTPEMRDGARAVARADAGPPIHEVPDGLISTGVGGGLRRVHRFIEEKVIANCDECRFAGLHQPHR